MLPSGGRRREISTESRELELDSLPAFSRQCTVQDARAEDFSGGNAPDAWKGGVAAISPVRLAEWLASTTETSSREGGAAVVAPPGGVPLERAVDLGWRIAARLLEVVEARPEGAGTAAELLAPDNILLCLESSMPTTVTEVRFQFELDSDNETNNRVEKGELTTMNICSQHTCNDTIGAVKQAGEDCERTSLQIKRPSGGTNLGRSNDSPNGSPDLSVALGRVLLNVFTGGKSAPDGTASVYNATESAGASLERAGKRHQNMANGTGSSIDLLRDQGFPLSITRLLRDLLEGSLTSLDEVVFDLACMKNKPQSFLFGRTCLQRVMEDTGLFSNHVEVEETLFGRDEEMDKLNAAKIRAEASVQDLCQDDGGKQVRERCHFVWEATFLSGYEGSGKSKLIQSVASSCHKEGWFVLTCKFDKHVSPEKLLTKAFDDWFGKCWGLLNKKKERTDSGPPSPAKDAELWKMSLLCRQVLAAVDDDRLHQLCELVPNFKKIFPERTSGCQGRARRISMDSIGSGEKKVQHLFLILLKSLCSVGVPVLLVLGEQLCSLCFPSTGRCESLQ